jgi:transcriptional regulator with XRE-family HTH domain
VQSFGEKLRLLRTQQGLTQRALAQALGYSNAHAYISDFETGKRKPTLEFALKIAQFFNVPVDQLVQDDVVLRLEGTAEPNGE